MGYAADSRRACSLCQEVCLGRGKRVRFMCVCLLTVSLFLPYQVPTTPSKSQWEDTPGRQKGSETPGATPSARMWDATPAAVTPGMLRVLASDSRMSYSVWVCDMSQVVRLREVKVADGGKPLNGERPQSGARLLKH